MISVVCPFFNEEAIIEESVRLMLRNLADLPEPWELIIVDDGSLDRSLARARQLEAEHAQLRVLRGQADRTSREPMELWRGVHRTLKWSSYR